jgi:hypothetical protein
VHASFPSPVTSAFPKVPAGRRTTKFRSATSERGVLRGCGHSIMFRPPSLLSRTPFVTSPRIRYASRPNGQLTAELFHLLRSAALLAAPGLSPLFFASLPCALSLGPSIADDTDAEMIGAEFERESVNVPALLMSIMACLLWIDVPSSNQAGIGSMPESVGRAMIYTNPKRSGAKPAGRGSVIFLSTPIVAANTTVSSTSRPHPRSKSFATTDRPRPAEN